MSRLIDKPANMVDKTIQNALTLFSREASATAHMPFTKKDKPLDLPADGFELAAKLAIHSAFRQLTIGHLSQTGRFQVAGEFRLVHDLTTFAESKVVALVFDPAANSATPFVISKSIDIENIDWQGPTIEGMLECNSIDELKTLMMDKNKHKATYTDIRTMVYFPPGFLEVLMSDVLIQDDIPRLCFHLGKHCKDLALTHYKNGKVRKGIQSHITSVFQFLAYHMIHEESTAVAFADTQDDMCDQYFEDLANHFPTSTTTPINQGEDENAINDRAESIASDEEIEEIDQTSHQESYKSIRSSDFPEIPFEVIPPNTVQSPESEKSSDSDLDSDDEEIEEPLPKKARMPSREDKRHGFSGHDLLRLANVFSKVAADDHDSVDHIEYGTKKNKLNKMNAYKINALKNACTKTGETPANLPESLIQLMENKTGPDMAAYMEGMLSDYNVAVCIGFCSSFLVGNLCNRMITSPTIQGFTNFAFGPREEESETYLLQQAINMGTNNHISEEDKRKLLNQKKYVPNDPDGLKSSIRNTVAASKMCFGGNAFITKALKCLKKSLKEVDPFLKPYFSTHGKVFGLHFAQSIHQGISMYLSKASNGVSHMKKEYLTFNDLILDIQMQRLRIAISSSWPHDKDRKPYSESPKTGEIVNTYKHKNQHLTNDRYRYLFSNRNRSGIEPPKTANGTPICWNFHAKGTCRANCPRKETHIKLSKDEINRWNTFTSELNKRLSGNNHGKHGGDKPHGR